MMDALEREALGEMLRYLRESLCSDHLTGYADSRIRCAIMIGENVEQRCARQRNLSGLLGDLGS